MCASEKWPQTSAARSENRGTSYRRSFYQASTAVEGQCSAAAHRGGEAEVLCDPCSVLSERFRQQSYSPPRFLQIVVFEVDVQQVDVPGQLDILRDVGFNNLPRDRQVVFFELSWTSRLLACRSFSYSSASSRANNSGVNRTAGLHADPIVVTGQVSRSCAAIPRGC